jgi:adenylylsulfate kinase
MSSDNLFTTFHLQLSRKEKEALLNQKGIVVWITGLSGSGKTTLANATEKLFFKEGKLTQLLDGDNIRSGLNKGLGFSLEERTENIRRIAEVAKLFKDSGIITFCAFVSPLDQLNQLARSIVGDKDFFHVYISTPLEECERRDVKGLYARARKGEIQNFTGISDVFEKPSRFELEIDTTNLSVIAASQNLFQRLLSSISH